MPNRLLASVCHASRLILVVISVLLQDNVALIAVLEMAPDPERGSSKQLICVANTHIHANPELNDVKLWQVHTLLKGLEKIANRYGVSEGSCLL